MSEELPADIEQLLADVAEGRPNAMERLTDAVYGPLRVLAEHQFRRRFAGAAEGLTWQPTVLVNETLLRIIGQRQRYDSKGHFFAIATTLMKRVLLDYIRERRAYKRQGAHAMLEFDPEQHSPADSRSDRELDMEAVFAAVDRLAVLDSQKADVARMRVIWGMSNPEIAASLAISLATVERHWRFAKAWLHRELSSIATQT